MLSSILDTAATTTAITPAGFALCTLASLGLGVVAALVFMYKNDNYTPSFAVTLALLPTVVQVVIMLVNGNLGAGVAVMGAFSLVRFRSTPGTAKDISAIFLAMAIGLATGMGYIGIAALLLAAMSLAGMLLINLKFGQKRIGRKLLRITIPESLDYTGAFDDLFEKYTISHQLVKVKTTNMGSLFDLEYLISMRDEGKEKQLIDEMRCRNGNLRIMCSSLLGSKDEL